LWLRPVVASASVCVVSYDVLLVSCVYEKLDHPAAARDLYVAERFRWARQFAERHTSPWFILSGEHALVRPLDWLAPYDTDLNDMSSEYRSAWGRWVVAKLVQDRGSLDGLVIEIHAPGSYIKPIAPPLQEAGAILQLPLAGVAWDEWPGWYQRFLAEDG
jgi:hypothetical protein